MGVGVSVGTSPSEGEGSHDGSKGSSFSVAMMVIVTRPGCDWTSMRTRARTETGKESWATMRGNDCSARCTVEESDATGFADGSCSSLAARTRG